jgi:hypothetical protein
MIEPVYVPYEQYRAAKTGCGLHSRIYGIYMYRSFSQLRQEARSQLSQEQSLF